MKRDFLNKLVIASVFCCSGLAGFNAMSYGQGGPGGGGGFGGRVLNITHVEGTIINVLYELYQDIPTGSIEPYLHIMERFEAPLENGRYAGLLGEEQDRYLIPLDKRDGPENPEDPPPQYTLTVDLRHPFGHYYILFSVGDGSGFTNFFASLTFNDGVESWSNDGFGSGSEGHMPVGATPIPTTCRNDLYSPAGVLEYIGNTGDTAFSDPSRYQQAWETFSLGIVPNEAGSGTIPFSWFGCAENMVYQSNLGLGFFTIFDSSVHGFMVGWYPNESHHQAMMRFVDVPTGRVFTFEDTIPSTTEAGGGSTDGAIDGKCYDEFGVIREARLLDENGSLVTTIAAATQIEIERHSGELMTFGRFDFANDDDEEKEYDAEYRLVKWVDLNKQGYEITYHNNVTFEIACIEDRFDRQIKFRYGTGAAGTGSSRVVGGRESITEIQLPNGTIANVSYQDFHISEMRVDDSASTIWKWTNNVVVDETAKTLTFEIDSPTDCLRKYQYTLDARWLHTGIVAQPANTLLSIKSFDESETMLRIEPHPTIEDAHYMYVGNHHSEMEVVQGVSISFIDPGEGVVEYEENEWEPDEGGIGGSGSLNGTPREWTLGLADQRKNRQEHRLHMEYDPDGFLTRRIYVEEDNPADPENPTPVVYETWQYNGNKQATRYRDRLGRVTKYVHDNCGNVIERIVGVFNDHPDDDPAADQTDVTITASYVALFHSTESSLKGQPVYREDPLENRTDYQYFANGLLKQRESPPDETGGPRGSVSYQYDNYHRLTLKQVTFETAENGLRDVSLREYDALNRVVKTTFADGSTEETIYGDGTTAPYGQIYHFKDRGGVITEYQYDDLCRVAQKIFGNLGDPNRQIKTVYTYVDGTSLPASVDVNGSITHYEYDAVNRVTESRVAPDASSPPLVSKTVYDLGLKFYEEDPYGRRSYASYYLPTARLQQIVQEAIPDSSARGSVHVNVDHPGNNVTRVSPDRNAPYGLIEPKSDVEGQVVTLIDARGIESTHYFDWRGRNCRNDYAVGTTDETRSEKIFDLAGNITFVRHPRYFDSSDTTGFGKCQEKYEYNGRNLVDTSILAFQSQAVSTTETKYYLNGSVKSVTDPRPDSLNGPGGTEMYWHKESGRSIGSGRVLNLNSPADSVGSFINTDFRGNLTHAGVVDDELQYLDISYSDSVDLVDADTESERTIRYDEINRPVASTKWNVTLTAVNPNTPTIADISSVDGFTTQYLYDEDLTDGIGLDNSTGMAPQFGGLAINLLNALAELAEPGPQDPPVIEGVLFDGSADGSATVVINPEGEIRFTVFDCLGRTVMTGTLDKGDGSTLVSWDVVSHDRLIDVQGFGVCLNNTLDETITNKTTGMGVYNDYIRGEIHVDGLHRVIQTVDGLDKKTSFEHDANGNVLSALDPNNTGVRSNVYDNLNRLVSSEDTYSDSWTYAYDQNGNQVTATDARGNTTQYTYDARNRVVEIEDRLGGFTKRVYDENSNILSLMDADQEASQGANTFFEYDERNLLTKTTYPDHISGTQQGDPNYGIVEQAEYDSSRRVRQRIDQAGNLIRFTYDPANRLVNREYFAHGDHINVADTDSFVYDKASRMTSAHSERYDNTCEFDYDLAGRETAERLIANNKTYQTTGVYDPNNRLNGMTYPDGTSCVHDFTERNLLWQTTYKGAVIETRSYDDGGRLQTCLAGNGKVATYTYQENGADRDNQIASIDISGVTRFDYTYDANKNKLSELIDNGSGTMSNWGFGGSGKTTTYDAENKITDWLRADGSRDLNWVRTLVGDWTKFNVNGQQQSRNFNDAHETTDIDGATVDHDARGNLVKDNQGRRYIYDFDNQLRYVDEDDDGINDYQHKYDALGRRIAYKKTGNSWMYYIHSGPRLIAEYNQAAGIGNPRRKYVYGSYVDEPILMDRRTGSSWNAWYYHRNAQMSIVAITHHDGSIRERYAYDAYGNTTILHQNGTSVRSSSNMSNPFMYTGRFYHSDVDQYYFRARFYDPALGQFLSRDPKGYVDGMSLYAGYFSPNGLDPTGMQDDGFFPNPIRWLTEPFVKPIENVINWKRGMQSGRENYRLRTFAGRDLSDKDSNQTIVESTLVPNGSGGFTVAREGGRYLSTMKADEAQMKAMTGMAEWNFGRYGINFYHGRVMTQTFTKLIRGLMEDGLEGTIRNVFKSKMKGYVQETFERGGEKLVEMKGPPDRNRQQTGHSQDEMIIGEPHSPSELSNIYVELGRYDSVNKDASTIKRALTRVIKGQRDRVHGITDYDEFHFLRDSVLEYKWVRDDNIRGVPNSKSEKPEDQKGFRSPRYYLIPDDEMHKLDRKYKLHILR